MREDSEVLIVSVIINLINKWPLDPGQWSLFWALISAFLNVDELANHPDLRVFYL